MATKKLYTIGNVKVRASNKKEAKRLAAEVAKDKKTPAKSKTASKTSSKKKDDDDEDISLESLLKSSNLTKDQKDMVRRVYGAVADNDKQSAAKLSAAIQQAMQYSDPYFKAQARMVVDSLDRGLNELEGDLAFSEQKLANSLKDLKNDVSTGLSNLSAEEAQELKALERRYTEDLDMTQQQLANTGFTQSSVRSKKEQLLNESFGDLRESTNRSFTARKDVLQDQLMRGQRDTQAELQRLQELTRQGKIDLLAKAEGTIGSEALKGLRLPALPEYNMIGGLPGTLAQDQAADALSFANSYIF